MSPLPNRKHEAFAQQLARGLALGWTAGAAYSRAGYRAEGRAAEAAACRLLKNVAVQARLAELQSRGARRAEITVQSLCDELEQARIGAESDKQFSASVQAVIAKARITGKWIDRIEQGAPGSFERAADADTVISMLLDQIPDPLALLDEMRRLIEHQLADRARALPAP